MATLRLHLKEVIASEQSLKNELMLIDQAGQERYYEYIFAPVLDSSGQVQAVAGSTRDITEQKSMIKRLENSVIEKSTLIKEVHHRVKNNLAVIAGLLGMQSDAVENESARTALSESQQRILSMALIHEHLYATEHLDSVNFAEYTEQIVSELRYLMQSTPI